LLSASPALKEISHKDAHKAQKGKAVGKKFVGMACRAVRYADMDRRTLGYANLFAHQGVSRSARPADAGQRDMRSCSENRVTLVHLCG
jgi:hypothetical protein